MCNFFINNLEKKDSNKIENQKIISKNIDNDKTLNNDQEKEQQENDDAEDTDNIEKLNWYIEIPVIDLKAPIKETTSMEILNNSVGHFEDTPKTIGNVGLAGHNRGYEKNYFENLEKLKIGQEIKYKYNNFENEYVIDKIEIIKNTNWSYLENTKENKLTLITCIENKPDYRRCVQATEKKK